MTEDEREELIYRFCDEFKASIGAAFNDEKKFSFVAGARRAATEIEQLRAALDNELAAHAVACQMRDEREQENQRLRSALWHVREDMAQLVQQVDKALIRWPMTEDESL